jgi:hypothetical protein
MECHNNNLMHTMNRGIPAKNMMEEEEETKSPIDT